MTKEYLQKILKQYEFDDSTNDFYKEVAAMIVYCFGLDEITTAKIIYDLLETEMANNNIMDETIVAKISDAPILKDTLFKVDPPYIPHVASDLLGQLIMSGVDFPMPMARKCIRITRERIKAYLKRQSVSDERKIIEKRREIILRERQQALTEIIKEEERQKRQHKLDTRFTCSVYIPKKESMEYAAFLTKKDVRDDPFYGTILATKTMANGSTIRLIASSDESKQAAIKVEVTESDGSNYFDLVTAPEEFSYCTVKAGDKSYNIQITRSTERSSNRHSAILKEAHARKKLPYPQNILSDIFHETYTAQISKEQEDALNLSIDALPEQNRQMLLMHYKEGITLTELGTIYNISRERARRRIFDALRELRRQK